jgi:hypothetical protein
MTPEQFTQSLHETFAWVLPRMNLNDLRWSMRSNELRPPHEFYRDGNPGFFNDSEYITHVVATRHRLLIGTAPAIPIAKNGRLLLSDYKVSNHNEATEHESGGFFDWADNPPWDLWVGEYAEKLIAWIPEPLIELVVRAERVECMGMFHWADDLLIDNRIPQWVRAS